MKKYHRDYNIPVRYKSAFNTGSKENQNPGRKKHAGIISYLFNF